MSAPAGRGDDAAWPAPITDVLAAAGPVGRKFAALGVDADSPTGAVGVYERAGFDVGYRAVASRIPPRG
jgi:hypothetical protein